jgi:hypothetical protein
MFSSYSSVNADDLQLADLPAALEFLIVSFAVAADFDFEKLRERVDNGSADAVQPPGDFIASGVELAAGVELCVD